jgi:hypothetical protein
MDAVKLVDSMERFGTILPVVVKGISLDEARWKPSAEDWSILEIIRHLGDEEVDDFRTRLRLTLEDPEQDWPRIAPEEWAVQRKYNEANFDEAVERFVNERAASIKWLRSLVGDRDVDWTIAHHHPRIGPIHAGDLLAAWAAHDCLHLRQISKRLYQLAQRDAGAFSVRYAGEW